MTLVRHQWRRDTAANWTANNPVLASGEPGFETDTNKYKVGNGVLAWNSLGYQMTPVLFDAKGDLLVGTGSDSFDRLPVGSNGKIIVADSTQTTGLKYSTSLFLEGSGSPEGSVTATIGSGYRDTTNGVWYIKVTGAGNTGWVSVGAGNSIVRVHRAAAVNITTTEADLVFDTVTFGNTALFNTSTGIYTAPTTGFYRVSPEVNATGSDGGRQTASVYVNGVAIATFAKLWPSGSNMSNGGSCVVSANAGEAIKVRIAVSSGGPFAVQTGSTATFASFERVG